MKAGRLIFKLFKVSLGLLLTLILSLVITGAAVLYSPPLFKWSLHALSQTVDDTKLRVFNTAELAQELELPEAASDEQAIFDYLLTRPGLARQDDSFFARSLMLREPDNCDYVVYGKHRSMDLFWVVTGNHCPRHGGRRFKRGDHR